ncbi:MAG: rhodanese-like domain-containing protein [Thioalkalivibrionaceae bacterium]
MIDFLSRHPILTGALIAIIALIVYTEFRRLTKKFKDVSPSEAVRVVNQDGALVLDVREDSELRSGRIGGARHIPIGQLGKRIDELERFKTKPALVYCRSGARSTMAAQQLVKAGFQDVHNLSGGIQAWMSAGLPVKSK